MDQRLFAVYGTHTDERRNAYDYYATHPIAARWLLRIEDIPKDKPIWECAAGEKHLSNAFEQEGYNVISTDIISRIEGVKQMDFLNAPEEYDSFDGTIVTNPPYKIAERFIYKALELVQDGNKVCMFLRLQFLEGKGRRQLFENYPPYVCGYRRAVYHAPTMGVLASMAIVPSPICGLCGRKGSKEKQH